MRHIFIFTLFIFSVLAVSPLRAKDVPPYNRRAWHHWVDKDKDCQDLRAELLIEQSLVDVDLDSKGCIVKRGKWKDFYQNKILKDASKVDIDHVVPLKYAHLHGGAFWSPELKEKFANDPDNLAITSQKINRAKGSKGIEEWMPHSRVFACRYVKRWFMVKKKYHLKISSLEKKYQKMLNCSE